MNITSSKEMIKDGWERLGVGKQFGIALTVGFVLGIILSAIGFWIFRTMRQSWIARKDRRGELKMQKQHEKLKKKLKISSPRAITFPADSQAAPYITGPQGSERGGLHDDYRESGLFTPSRLPPQVPVVGSSRFPNDHQDRHEENSRGSYNGTHENSHRASSHVGEYPNSGTGASSRTVGKEFDDLPLTPPGGM
ncbi:hypothetical protein F5Y16DRAFT_386069, partial [Xylariaceae sp. FL0255]